MFVCLKREYFKITNTSFSSTCGKILYRACAVGQFCDQISRCLHGLNFNFVILVSGGNSATQARIYVQYGQFPRPELPERRN
jgi:hypothetical protein